MTALTTTEAIAGFLTPTGGLVVLLALHVVIRPCALMAARTRFRLIVGCIP